MTHDDELMRDRHAQRIRSFLGAKIVLSGGHSVFDCLVKDISEAGARLKVENVVVIPETFELRIVDGRRFECTIRWRSQGFVGVEFGPR
jgi:hypothetical protein